MRMIWPLDYYIKETRVSFDDNQQKKLRFASFSAIFQAAYDLIRFYEDLNEKNLCFIGSPKEVLQFDMNTGRMEELTDRRDIHPLPVSARALEVQNDYSAPELILGTEMNYSLHTQNWTLAVLLYELLFHTDHPFKGKDSFMQVFYSYEEELFYLAQTAGFNCEADLNHKNRPVHGAQDNLINYWDIYPECVRHAMLQTLGEGKHDVNKRKTPQQWRNVIHRMEKEYITCICGSRRFAQSFEHEENLIRCPKCGNIYRILESDIGRIYLCNGTEIDSCQLYASEETVSFVAAQVVENKQKKGLFGIKNMSSQEWKGLFPNGEERPIKPGGGIPLWPGLVITVDDGTVWKIKGA